jgi:hypothetical protein
VLFFERDEHGRLVPPEGCVEPPDPFAVFRAQKSRWRLPTHVLERQFHERLREGQAGGR